jgi:hypothetical protein
VEPRCTCGAVLPPDARFCHRCGKPQYAEDIARIEEQERQISAAPSAAVVTPERTEVSPISFRNSRAVFISLVVAAVALVGSMVLALAAATPLFPFFLCAIGFSAVWFYNRGSSARLSTSAGARLGWMTGLWLFIVVALMVGIVIVFGSSQEGWAQMQDAFARTQQASELMKLTQHDFLVQMLLFVPFSFILLTMLPGLGGILGAKFSGRRRSS